MDDSLPRAQLFTHLFEFNQQCYRTWHKELPVWPSGIALQVQLDAFNTCHLPGQGNTIILKRLFQAINRLLPPPDAHAYATERRCDFDATQHRDTCCAPDLHHVAAFHICQIRKGSFARP